MFRSIKEFKMPDHPTITGIRSWFGLVNQLNPFRELLKSSNTNSTRKIYWDNELECMFEKAKLPIIDMAKNGLANFDCTKKMTMVTDWSKQGIGFVLLQKH